ncbi:MAG: DNA polymerase III subunit delta [Gemmatimonadaceae bacterium]
MPSDGERELYRAIKQGQFSPAYLLFGENDYLKDGAIADLVAAAVEPATRDFNFDQVRGDAISAEGLEALLRTPPMMAVRRVVVLRDVHSMKKDVRAVLDRYLETASKDLLLIMTSGAGGKTEQSARMDVVAVEFGPLSAERLPKWVRHRATSLGVQINDEAIRLLLRAVGDDLPQLASELEKLANYCGERVIDEPAVSAVVGVRHGETLADLLDAIAARDTSKAMELLPFVLEQPKTGAVPILMALTSQTLGIAWGRAKKAHGAPDYVLQREFFTLLKEARAFPGRPWGEAVKVWIQAIPHWREESLQRSLDVLLEADRAAKESRFSSEEQLLRTVVLSMCSDARGHAA